MAALEKADAIVAKAATTKLEFQCLLALCNMGKDKASKEIKSCEREYGLKYRLTRQSQVHAALTAWRNGAIGAGNVQNRCEHFQSLLFRLAIGFLCVVLNCVGSLALFGSHPQD